MIIETIITTVGSDGVVNIAPMGVEWGEQEIVVKPFLDTTTFRNLVATREAVINLTDDALLFARAALSTVTTDDVAIEPARVVAGAVLCDACSWRELRVRSLDDTPPRARIVTDVVHRELRREFLGFNRARHAVLEAAILATRTHLIPPDTIREQLAHLQVIVDKTAGPREHEAMTVIAAHVERATRGPAPA